MYDASENAIADFHAMEISVLLDCNVENTNQIVIVHSSSRSSRHAKLLSPTLPGLQGMQNCWAQRWKPGLQVGDRLEH